MLELKFKVHVKIQKPLGEVFDAVYNPQKLSRYFTTGGASAPMDGGTTVTWDFADFPGAFPVHVKKMVKDSLIIFEWGAEEPSEATPGMLQVEMTFEALPDGSTLVNVSESGWKETPEGLDASYKNCFGWTQMIFAMKAFLEHCINLRQGAF